MARRSRTSVLKRQREAQKRQREKRKAEKAATKRERRHGKPAGTSMASRDDLIALGVIDAPEPASDTDEESKDKADESSPAAG